MNLKQKLIEIRKEVEFLQKDTEGYNYKYVSEDKVLFAIKEKMNELQVLLVPSVLNHSATPHTYKNSYGKDVTENIIKGDMIFTWYDAESEEELIVPFALYGQQADASQAFGSGLTYSNRYFLLKFFQVATNENDPDKVVSKKKEKESKEEVAFKKMVHQKNQLGQKLLLEAGNDKVKAGVAKNLMLKELGYDTWEQVDLSKTSEQVVLNTFIMNLPKETE